MKGDHVVTVPHQIWEWAQQKSGKKNPASNIRELLWAAWVADIQGTPPVVDVETAKPEDKWVIYGLQLDPIDPEFTAARNAFVVQCGSEEAALEWFEKASKRGIHNPRAFLMSWYHKQAQTS